MKGPTMPHNAPSTITTLAAGLALLLATAGAPAVAAQAGTIDVGIDIPAASVAPDGTYVLSGPTDAITFVRVQVSAHLADGSAVEQGNVTLTMTYEGTTDAALGIEASTANGFVFDGTGRISIRTMVHHDQPPVSANVAWAPGLYTLTAQVDVPGDGGATGTAHASVWIGPLPGEQPL